MLLLCATLCGVLFAWVLGAYLNLWGWRAFLFKPIHCLPRDRTQDEGKSFSTQMFDISLAELICLTQAVFPWLDRMQRRPLHTKTNKLEEERLFWVLNRSQMLWYHVPQAMHIMQSNTKKRQYTNVKYILLSCSSSWAVIAKVSSVHCSTSGLALGSPGCLFVVVRRHHARNTF